MITIRNSTVTIMSDGGVSIIAAFMADQDDDTVKMLGRGQMYGSFPGMGLKYMLKSGIMVALWCD